ncbi:hypothetical protein Bca52824_088506 [Brassica carinata]|uniref:Uncharacterized protein n=1 Tax=Brassica carinata TaxID=52824 RepID=A0A8X7PDH4_BRACI|nr:hypothetical protein Bca52824_088506 [Brassica carinata]
MWLHITLNCRPLRHVHLCLHFLRHLYLRSAITSLTFPNYFCSDSSKNLTRDVGESRVSEGALSDQLLSHSFSICSMKMSCLVSLTCSFVPFDTSLTRPTHSIIISSPIVNKLHGLEDHAVKQRKDPTGSHGSKEQTRT